MKLSVKVQSMQMSYQIIGKTTSRNVNEIKETVIGLEVHFGEHPWLSMLV